MNVRHTPAAPTMPAATPQPVAQLLLGPLAVQACWNDALLLALGNTLAFQCLLCIEQRQAMRRAFRALGGHHGGEEGPAR